MHYHLEIVMPPVDDAEEAVTQILAPFDEGADPGENGDGRHAFWDWWVIGGRWSGEKLMALLGKEKVTGFIKSLADYKITVSGVTLGKHTLQPADQAELVDRLWNEAFPDSPVKQCPIFDYYKGSFGDVMPLAECPKDLKCESVIIAGPSYRDDGTLEAKYMLRERLWNGVTHQQTDWSGLLSDAVEQYRGRLGSYKPEYAAKYGVTDDWLVVTVDYHS